MKILRRSMDQLSSRLVHELRKRGVFCRSSSRYAAQRAIPSGSHCSASPLRQRVRWYSRVTQRRHWRRQHLSEIQTTPMPRLTTAYRQRRSVMPDITKLLSSPLRVVNVGADLFADAISQQGTPVTRVTWQPAPGKSDEALSILLADPRIDAANQEAVQHMTAARPRLVDVRPAGEVIPGMHKHLLLHAGPPISWERMSGPLRGAIIGALIYEGLANDAEAAERLAASGEIEFAPCHHYNAVGPMAGVTSISMPVQIIEEPVYGNRTFSTLNEGLGKVLRYGANSSEVIDRLRWIEHVLGPALARALRVKGGMDIKPLTAQAL